MNNRLSHGLHRAIETIVGIPATRHLAALAESQWFDRLAIEALQRRNLADLVGYASRHVAHYREVLDSEVLDSGVLEKLKGEEALEALRGLPILTKEAARRNTERLFAPGGGRALRLSTSGSTGAPLEVRVDRPAFARAFAAKLRALDWYDVRFSDRQLRIWGRTTTPTGKLWWALRDALQNRQRLTTFDLSDAALDRALARLERFKPTYINGYTSGIHRLAGHVLARGIDCSAWHTRAVLPTSEVLLPAQRQQMERAFKAPVVNEYGCGEVHAIAYECPNGRLHPTHEHMVIELLDEAGKPVPTGHAGLVTLTSFLNRAMPMIRYQNGDVAEWSTAGDCDCGRHPGLPTLRSITGRSADVLRRTDGTVSHWTTLYYAVKECFPAGALDEHQACQTALDRLVIQVVPGEELTPSMLERFAARLRRELGADLQVEFEAVDTIDRGVSGKLKYFLSRIPDHGPPPSPQRLETDGPIPEDPEA